MPASILAIPLEPLRKIVLFAIATAPAGPPRELYSMRLTCRHFHLALATNSDDFYTWIFCHKFDISAPSERYGGLDALKRHTQHELRRRFDALRCIRRPHAIEAPRMREVFWTLYLMTLEDDGLNSVQLQWAGSLNFIKAYMRQFLYQGSNENSGWPVANEVNTLAVVLLWRLSSSTSMQDESVESCNELMDLIRPFVFGAFRYPIYLSWKCGFNPHTYAGSREIGGAESLLRLRRVTCFGKIVQTYRIPTIATPAILAYFSRFETKSVQIPGHLARNRAEADAAGRLGPTREDAEEFARNFRTRLVAKDTYGVTRRPMRHQLYDADWSRLCCTTASLPRYISQKQAYAPGVATGSWQGSFNLPCRNEYSDWMNALQAPHCSSLRETSRQPLYCALQEYVSYRSSSSVPFDKAENGITNAWLPSGCRWAKTINGIELFDEAGTFTSIYETLDPAATEQDSSKRVTDVIVIGKTAKKHGDAWGFYDFVGRIRLWDGLIVLRRISACGLPDGLADKLTFYQLAGGEMLLRGYITSSQNFTGRLCDAIIGVSPNPWQAPFSLSKSED